MKIIDKLAWICLKEHRIVSETLTVDTLSFPRSRESRHMDARLLPSGMTRTKNRDCPRSAFPLQKEHRILSVRSHGKDRFYMPGGKREDGESDTEALTREIKEELMVDLLPETLTFADSFEAPADGQAEGFVVRLTCYFGEYQGELQASSEIAEFAWLGYGDKDKISAANLLVFEWLQQRGMLK